MTIGQLYSALASADAAQAGAAACTVAVAMGVSLLAMVAALPTTRSGSGDDRAALLTVANGLVGLRRQLTEMMDVEAAMRLVAARRMPQGTNTERAEREAAIQLALRVAAELPLNLMRSSVLALKHAQVVAERGSRAVAADTELAIGLLQVGLSAARSHLEVKLSALTDEQYTRTIVEEMSRLAVEGTSAAHAAASHLRALPT